MGLDSASGQNIANNSAQHRTLFICDCVIKVILPQDLPCCVYMLSISNIMCFLQRCGHGLVGNLHAKFK